MPEEKSEQMPVTIRLHISGGHTCAECVSNTLPWACCKPFCGFFTPGQVHVLAPKKWVWSGVKLTHSAALLSGSSEQTVV